MRNVLSFILGFTACTAVLAQLPPIPTRMPGYSVGPSDAPLQLTAYFDLACPDSAAAAPTLAALSTKYNQALRIRYVLLPLPYHVSAFAAAQGSQVAAALGKQRYAWQTAMFANQAQFFNGALQNTSPTQLAASLADLASSTLSVSRTSFLAGLQNGTLNEAARVEWKAAVTAGVSGTPTFFVNSVPVAAESTWTVQQWSNLLDPILSGNVQL